MASGKKEITIAAKFDTSDFDKSVESMQKKLKEIYAPADAVRAQTQTQQRLQQIGMGASAGSPSSEQMTKAVQTARRENDQAIREQVLGQEKLNKLLVLRQNSLEDLKKRQAEAVEGSKKELELKEKIGAVEANNARIRETIAGKDKAINMALDRRQAEITAAGPQGAQTYERDKPSRWEAYKERMGGMGGAVGGLALGFAGGLGTVAAIGERYAGYGQRLEAARGSAIQNSVGIDLAQTYNGQSVAENAFLPERKAASGLAAQKESRNKFWDRTKGVASSIGVGAGGYMLGAGLIGAVGSVVAAPATFGASLAALPGSLTMAGAGAAGLAAGAYGLSNDRTRMSMVPGSKEYQQLLAGERMQNFRSSYEDLKSQDPEKRSTIEGFEANRDRNVRGQRLMGLSNEQFYGDKGFMHQTAMAGFSTEQGLQNAQAIIGAGGSSRMANNPLGMQMDRAGLNGSQMLGTLSGSIQAPEANRRAVVSIMSEAFKTGLDATEFAEENRRFTQAAANIIGKTGVSGSDDQDRLAGVLGSLLGSKTNQGVTQAQTDYEKVQERSSQTSGRRGALRFSASMKDPLLGRLSTNDQSELLSMRDEDLNEQNPALAALAEAAGPGADGKPTTVQDIIKARQGVDKKGRYLSPDQEKRMASSKAKLQKYLDDNGKSVSDLGDDIKSGRAPQDIVAAAGRMKLELSSTDSPGGITSGEGIGNLGEFLTSGLMSGDTKKKASGAIDKSERIEDAYTKKAAEGADEARQAFNRLTAELWNVVKGVDAIKESAAKNATELSGIAKDNLKSLPQGSGTSQDIFSRFGVGASQQSQGAKPKGK